jgi:hypothetical protein
MGRWPIRFGRSAIVLHVVQVAGEPREVGIMPVADSPTLVPNDVAGGSSCHCCACLYADSLDLGRSVLLVGLATPRSSLLRLDSAFAP